MEKTQIFVPNTRLEWDKTSQKFIIPVDAKWPEIIETASIIARLVTDFLEIEVVDLLSRQHERTTHIITYGQTVFVILMLERHQELNLKPVFWGNFINFSLEMHIGSFVKSCQKQHNIYLSAYGNEYEHFFKRIKKKLDSEYPIFTENDSLLSKIIELSKEEILKIAFGAVLLDTQNGSSESRLVFPASHEAFGEMLFLAIEKVFGFDKEQVCSKTRKREVVECRRIFYALHYENYPRISLARIGRKVGGRNHATVLHGITEHKMFMGNKGKDKYSISCCEKVAKVLYVLPSFLKIAVEAEEKSGISPSAKLSYGEAVDWLDSIIEEHIDEKKFFIRQTILKIKKECLSLPWGTRASLRNILKRNGVKLKEEEDQQNAV